MRSFRHLVDVIGVGEHGIARVLMGDWNDGIVVSQVPNDLKPEVREKGETTLNSAMACYVLEHYARLLSYLGDKKVAEEARAKAEAQRVALRAVWAGRWFQRAWLGPHLGWLGEDHLWLEPQPWAIIGGAATAEQSEVLVKAIDELVRKPTPIGALIQSVPTPSMTSPPGILENGGVWPSINGTLIWALALKDGAMAWDEWKKNSLACKAEAYPNIWYGIWSGPDCWSSVLSDHPGETQHWDPNSKNEKERVDGWGFAWTDCPVMNLHQHAWPLYTAGKLMGLEFHESGINLAPVLPLAEYDFTTKLVGVKKSKSGYSGWYDPSVAGSWVIWFGLPEAEFKKARSYTVNGVEQRIPMAKVTSAISSRQSSVTVNGVEQKTNKTMGLRIAGESKPGKPLRWEVRLA